MDRNNNTFLEWAWAWAVWDKAAPAPVLPARMELSLCPAVKPCLKAPLAPPAATEHLSYLRVNLFLPIWNLAGGILTPPQKNWNPGGFHRVIVLPGLSPLLVTFKIKFVSWSGDRSASGGKGFACLEAVLNGSKFKCLLQCCSKSHPITGHCDKPCAFTSEMCFFLLMVKRVAVNDSCRKRRILCEDSPWPFLKGRTLSSNSCCVQGNFQG